MSHPAQVEFCQHVKAMFPSHFSRVKVLDIGSLDVNGTNRDLFTESEYTGCDIGAGKNVDLVCLAHEVDAPDGWFDTIVSTEAFEHDMHWFKSMTNALRMLRVGGLFTFTCAGEGRGRHGTVDKDPDMCPLIPRGEWSSYYRNLTPSDVENVPSIHDLNPRCYSVLGEDLQFWGIKKR